MVILKSVNSNNAIKGINKKIDCIDKEMEKLSYASKEWKDSDEMKRLIKKDINILKLKKNILLASLKTVKGYKSFKEEITE